MASSRELKNRINSVHSSQKITGAMKMIASAKLRKAENALYNTRPYLEELQQMGRMVRAQETQYITPFSEKRPLRKAGIVVFGSDDGLCGSFNLTILKRSLEMLMLYKEKTGQTVKVYAVGKKIRTELKKHEEVELIHIPNMNTPKMYNKGILQLADRLMADFIQGELDHVEVVYTHFVSIGTQEITSRQLLPRVSWAQEEQKGNPPARYIYEPDGQTILEMLYPLAIRADLLQRLLENQASEQAARILAMQMANDNARKLLKELQLEYNKLRQENITTELLDIAGGAQE